MLSFIEDVSSLTNQELLHYSEKLAQHENDVGLRLIACLREAEKRLLYCELDYSSLWEFATKRLGLSNGNAQMKIDAMRLTRDNPVAQQKIETGELSIFNAAKVNSFFRQESKAGKPYSPAEKTEVIESVLGLSQSKCEKVLLARSPESVPTEKVRQLTENHKEVKIVIEEKTWVVLQRLKDLLSNQMPNATYAELLDYLAREKVEVLEKKQMGATLAELDKNASITTPSGVDLDRSNTMKDFYPTPREYIKIEDRRWVARRARGQCEHIGENNRRCTSRYRLQIDHIVPLARGGRNERSNYRLLCKQHNLYYAKRYLGNIMNRYVSAFRG